MLFKNYDRDYTNYKTRKISAYEFLDKSAWKIASFMRNFCNSWSQDFADDKEFISRFQSKLDKQHYSACFELLTYTIFKNSGFFIEKHPFTGTKKRLDFGIQFGTSNKGYLECTLSSNSFENLKEKNQKETIEEIIEEIEYYPYFINLYFKQTSDVSISKKKLLSFIDEIKERSVGISNIDFLNQKHHFVNNGWEIEISLIRKLNPKVKRSLGAITQSARLINTSKPVLTALMDKKPSNYGITTHPYVICLNTNDLFISEECFSEVLFGQYGNKRIDLQYSYQKGFYYANNKQINTTVSAVIFFQNFDLFTLDRSSITVWHNPFAKNPFPVNTLPFNESIFENKVTYLEQIMISKDKDILKILGIDNETYIALKKDKSGS